MYYTINWYIYILAYLSFANKPFVFSFSGVLQYLHQLCYKCRRQWMQAVQKADYIFHDNLFEEEHQYKNFRILFLYKRSHLVADIFAYRY